MIQKKTVPLLILLLLAAAALVLYCAVSGHTPEEQTVTIGETAEQALMTAEKLDVSIRKAMEGNRLGEILLSDEGSTASCPGITITEKTIEITAPGIYQVSGSLDGGQLMIRCKGNVGLVLNGISVLNPDGPAISAEDASHVQLWLAEGTENHLVSGTPVEITGQPDDSGEEISGAAIYLRDTLSIAGTGTLIAEGYLHNAISSTDHVVILDGNLRLTAVNHGIRGKDSVTVTGGKITILSGNDGIHSVNNDQEDAITGAIRVTGGETEIRCYGDGLQAGKDLFVSDGTVTVTAGDTENIMMNAAQNPPLPGMEGSGQMNGMAMPGGQQPPDGKQMPGGQQPPDGMQMPGGQQPPDGMQPPGGQQPPDGIQKPDGTGEADPFNGKNDQHGEFGRAGGGMDPRGTWNYGFNNMEGNPNKTDEASGGKGLKSGGTLTVSSGTVTITSADDSLHADDEVSIQGGNLQLISGDDGINGANRVIITDGTVNILQSYEGIEGHEISVSGGTISVTASDDGFNANGGSDMFSGFSRRDSAEEDVHPVLRISGGDIHVNAGGDGLDSNADLLILGGTIIVDGPENGGNGALDSGSENGGVMTADGGTILAVGASDMAESFGSQSAQCSFIESFDSMFPAGTRILILNQDGEKLFEYTSEKSFNSVVFSSPELHVGETVTLTVGEETAEVVLENISNGESNGFSMPGGFGNFRKR